MTEKILSVDQRLAHKVEGSPAVNETPNPSISPAPNDVSTLQPPTTIAPAAPATTSTNRPRYRALPPRDQPTTQLSITKKRKHALKSRGPRPVRYFEGSGSEGSGNGHESGDGSSSGDSIPSDVPTNAKRQKTSGIVTRSSTRTPAPDVGDGEPLDSISLPPVVLARLPIVTAGTRVSVSETTSGTTDIVPPAVNTSHDIGLPHTKSVALTGIDTEPTDTATDDTVPDDTAPDDTAPDDTAPDDMAPDDTKSDLIPDGPLWSPTRIEAEDVPSFLRHHGRGKRVVDIFAYLNKVEDPHFRQILFHYIQFEANAKSRAGGTLPTAGRPAEIVWWTSRARPSGIPNLLEGSKTFKMFTDSVLGWWSSIQPSWRVFRQGEASREVNGSWEGLNASQINGLLNVVILAYWWVSLLDKDKLEDGAREDYKFFANDVAWVLSKLSIA